MNALIESRRSELLQLCLKHGVRRLAVFGSGASERFDPAASDLDFVVEFKPMSPAEHADGYFGLQEDLEELFRVPVELVEPGPIRNPYFRQAVEQTEVVLFDIAA